MNKNYITEKNTDLSLEEMYKNIMEGFPSKSFQLSSDLNNKDRYKQYSVCDLSKYETVLSSNIIIKD